MTLPRIALIYDNRPRPETTGTYCLRALRDFAHVQHFLPQECNRIPRTGFDLYLNIDDGLRYRLPGDLHPCAWWVIDTHLDPAWAAEKGRDFDWRFAAQQDGAARLTGLGLHTTWLPLAHDPQIHRPHAVARRWDVAFVGHDLPGPRHEVLELIRREFGNVFIGNAYFEDFARIYSECRIGFNRSVENDVNMRVFETLGCGALLVTNDLRDNGQEELLVSGRHCVTYQNHDELLDNLRFYLAHDDLREQIAEAGHAEVLARHTYRHRMQTLLETVGWPGQADRAAREVAELARVRADDEPNSNRRLKAELQQIDIIIKTFLRPQALLRLLRSITEFYPLAHVTIADDGNLRESTDADSRACCDLIDWNARFELYSLPFAAGVTAGRNLLIDATTRPYVLLLDDDFCFTAETRIEQFLERLKSNPQLGVVAGACIDVVGNDRRPRNSGGTLCIEGDTLVVDSTGWLDRSQGLRDYVPHFALIRREVFRDLRWEGGLGAEHYDFCLQLKQSRWQVAQDPAVRIDHHHFSESLPGYLEHRFNYAAAQQWLLQKWKLSRIVQDGELVVERAETGSEKSEERGETSIVGQAVPDALRSAPEERTPSQQIDASHGANSNLNRGRNVTTREMPGLEPAKTDESLLRQAQPDLRKFAAGARALKPALALKDSFYFDLPRPEVVALIPETARRVLDLGCGAGALGALLKDRQSVEVVGVELHPAAAKLARQRLDQVFELNIEDPSVEFPAGSFDCVVCADVLEHLREPSQLLEKIGRWLTPGGALVASIPNVRHHSVVTSLLEGNWTYESAGLLDQDHVRFFTRREIEKLLYRQGFEVQTLQAVLGPGDEARRAAVRPGRVRIGSLDIAGMSPAAADEFYAYQYLVVAQSTLPPLARGGRGGSRSLSADPHSTPDCCQPPHPLTSIIIVTHNECAYTKECVDSIRLRTDEPYELIFVDNGSTDRTLEYLRSLSTPVGWVSTHTSPHARGLQSTHLIENSDNRGFPAAVNQGLKIARGDHVVLLNNDTVVTTGWLRRILNVFDSDRRIGLVGPCSNNVSGAQMVPVTYYDMASLDGFAWDWGTRHRGIVEDTDRLIGFCLGIKRAVLDQIGLLDEQFGIGCYEDDDLCLRALQAGWRAVIARAAFVHHYGSRTFQGSGIDLGNVLDANRRKFLDKWAPDTPPLSKGGAGGVALSGVTPEVAWTSVHVPLDWRGLKSTVPIENDNRRDVAISPSSPSDLTVAGSLPVPSAASIPDNSAFRTPHSALHAPLDSCGLKPTLPADVPGSPRLSLCMIVRDNETTIGPALASIRPWVDEIIVVDTGSQDRTPEICRQHGARLFEFPWCDDFSAARNESLQHARGDWIFWMDSDDTISADCGRKLRELVDGFYAVPPSAEDRTPQSSASSVAEFVRIPSDTETPELSRGRLPQLPSGTSAAPLTGGHDHETAEAELLTRRSQAEYGNERNVSDDLPFHTPNSALRTPQVLGYILQVHCPGPGDEGQLDVTVVDHVKLVRNRPDLRFEGRIHEQLLPAIRRAGGEVAWTDIHVVHSGSDHSPAGWQRKLERDLRILHRELEESPDHPFVLFNLGMTYADAARATVGQAVPDSVVPPPESSAPNADIPGLSQNDFRPARQAQPDLRNSNGNASDRAIAYLRQCLAVSPPAGSHVRKAYALLVSSLAHAGRHDEAWTACQAGLALYPSDKELLFRSAMLHHHFGRLVEAEAAYLQVLTEPIERHLASIDQNLAGYKARHNLAIVYEDLGRFYHAEAQWRQIVQDMPTYTLGRRGLEENLRCQGRIAEGVRRMHV